MLPHLPLGDSTQLGPGDDAALVAFPDGRAVVTTDVLVEGVHFTRDWFTPQDVGWRAAMQNLADVAAMGATPAALVVALTAPPETDLAWFEGFADGLAEVCAPLGVGVVGGDLSRGPVLSAAVTALGSLNGRAPVLRSGAQVGDVLALAGETGWSAAGLALLRAGLGGEHGLPAGADRALASFRRPLCPLEAGPAAAMAGATAMMDVSDGLLKDAGRLAKASSVALEVDPVRLARPLNALQNLGRLLGTEPMDWVLSGGEDHALLATFPQVTALPAGWAVIGRVVDAPSRVTVLGGHRPAQTGWDHFGVDYPSWT
jgi:thiamine-monophosphate kinase